MAKGRMNRYSRRTSVSIRHSHTAAIVIAVAVFLLLCFAISVLVGLHLGKQADRYQPAPELELFYEPYASGEKTVKPVDAYAYEWGASAKPYAARGVTDFSVCLRGADGALTYTSEIGGLKGFCEMTEGVLLSEEVPYLHEYDGYVCAYFYVRSLETEDLALRELYKAYEIALVEEAARLGVDDVMLVGLDIRDDNVAEIERYVSDMAKAAGRCVLGVLVTPELVIKTDQGSYLAPRIRSVCDYLALDLRGLSADAGAIPEAESGEDKKESLLFQTLEGVEYYIRSYGMRIVLSKENAALYESAKELGVISLQIIGE